MTDDEVVPSISAQAEALKHLYKQASVLRGNLRAIETGIELLLTQMQIINADMTKTLEQINGGEIPPCPKGVFKELNGG